MGRLVFIYVAVLNASREATRYGVASGAIGNGNLNAQYTDCPGIKAAVRKVGFLITIPDEYISIRYDQGPGTPVTTECATGSVPASGYVRTGTRIVVKVDVPFSTMLTLVPISMPSISSASARTILSNVNISGTAEVPPTMNYSSLSTATPTRTPTNTVTVTATPTATGTATLTATVTPTWLYTATLTQTATVTTTATLTLTPTITPAPTFTMTPTVTATMTSTPTVTPTVVCANFFISAPILQADDSSEHTWKVMLSNTSSLALRVENIQVIWHQKGSTFATLSRIQGFGSAPSDLDILNINNATGNATINVLTTNSIPAIGGVTLVVSFVPSSSGGNNILPALGPEDFIKVTAGGCTQTAPGALPGQ
jgi:hypothetical protein